MRIVGSTPHPGCVTDEEAPRPIRQCANRGVEIRIAQLLPTRLLFGVIRGARNAFLQSHFFWFVAQRGNFVVSVRNAYHPGMASTTVAVGVALIILGLVGYFLTGAASLTALIPAAFGIVILLAGLIGRDERRRKYAIHVAIVVALFGLLGSLRGLLQIGDVFAGTAARPAAVVSQAVMAVLTLGYVILAVRSFIAARRSGDVKTKP